MVRGTRRSNSPMPVYTVPMKPSIRMPLASLVAAVALVGAGLVHQRMTLLSAEVEAVVLTEAQLQRVIDAQRTVMQAGLVPLPGERDAGPVLNSYFAVEHYAAPGSPALIAAWWAEDEAAIALKCRGAPQDERSAYLRCVDTLPDGDLTLLQALLVYDTWSLTASGPLASTPDRRAAEEALGSSPWLDLIPLQHLAKLRIAQGMRRGDVLAALGEVRHLANLVLTTEDYLGLRIGLALLGIEHRGAQEATRIGLIQPGEWTSRPDAERYALRDAIDGMAALAYGRAPEGALARLLAEVPNPVGLCETFTVGSEWLRAHRWLGQHRWPGEPDFTPRVKYLQDVSASGRCDDARLMASWRAQDQDIQHVRRLFIDHRQELWLDEDWLSDEARAAREEALAKLPYLRIVRLSDALLDTLKVSTIPGSR